MNSNKLIKSAVRGIALAALLAGCSSSDNPGGTTGSGGSSSTGSGGSSSTGTGGSSSTGTGGLSATGGSFSTGTGGSSTGGSTGTGGVANTGGSAGSGNDGSGGAAGGSGRAGAGGHGGVTGGGGHSFGGGSDTAGRSGSAGSSGSSFALTSMHLADGAHFDSKYTCASNNGQLGGGVNPDLEWANPPAGTMSFAITFLDMTLINAGGSNTKLGEHWAIWNIPATVSTFPEATKTLSGDLANAKQSGTYLAPCAQSLMNSMDDQYEFTIYALSTATLNVSSASVANARSALMTAMSAGQVLGTAVLHGHARLKGM